MTYKQLEKLNEKSKKSKAEKCRVHDFNTFKGTCILESKVHGTFKKCRVLEVIQKIEHGEAYLTNPSALMHWNQLEESK